MITISATEAILGGIILLLVEVSIHLRFRPLKIQLATIEQLLRRDQVTIFETLGEHEERLEAIEGKLEDHLKKG